MIPTYSEDLQWRIVWLYLLRGLNYWEISVVSEKSVQRYVGSYETTGSVAPASQKHSLLLSDFEQEFLLESLIADPSTSLTEHLLEG